MTVRGPEIIARSMSVPRPRGPSKAMWQYHSRSDLHSKVACWAVLFDLLQQSALLRDHVSTGKVVFGVNHEMVDFQWNRKKDLDLVIARPGGDADPSGLTFPELGRRFQVVLGGQDQRVLDDLPDGREGPVGAVLVALEAKAAMTAHTKAKPRLYDELNSSHLTVHGASSQALAVGLVMVNAAETFYSPDLNRPHNTPTVPSTHAQPRAAEDVMSKVREIPRRSGSSGVGFDGLGILVVDCVNDGTTPVTLVSSPGPPPGDIFAYASMITRVAHEYDATFSAI